MTAEHKALLVLPRLRIQNANSISSPLTWGFPAITAFTGLMVAIERRLGLNAGVSFYGVGVVGHGFEPRVTTAGYERSFHLTRNPLLQDGSTAAIVEEGRVHIDITVVFDIELATRLLGETSRVELAEKVADLVAGMRVAGGSVIPALHSDHQAVQAGVYLLPDDSNERLKVFRRLCRRWLPGFALVSRDDLLQSHLALMRHQDTSATLLEAWLDLSRLNHRAVRQTQINEKTGEAIEHVEWLTDRRPGWMVPIPVGYAALSELYPPGTVAGARDMTVPFRFVESVYSIGEWVSPHRLRDVGDVFWEPTYDPSIGLYRCVNNYQSQIDLRNLIAATRFTDSN
jgi:CRISPR-associated protein Csy2